MEKQTTVKNLRRFKDVIRIDYKLYQKHFEGKKKPVYYNAGKYGHNFDVFIIEGYALIFGDRPIKTTLKLTLENYDEWLKQAKKW